jgi:phosphate-selective porin OprO/OprP
MRTTTFRRTAAGLLMTLFTATAAAAQQPSPQPITAAAAVPPSDTAKLVDELAARIDELDQQLRVLQRKLEIEKEQSADKAKVTPTVVAGREGYAVRSADGDFQLKFRGYVQADSRFVGDGDGTSGPTNFVLRRVRPVLEATAFKLFDFKLMPDFAGGTTVLQDAYADLKFVPWLKVRAGKF